MTQRGGILNRAGRCIWTLTFILALTGRGDRERALLGREAAPHLGFYCDREQSSALRTTLRLIPGAGVTPAEGSVKPTAGFTTNLIVQFPYFPTIHSIRSALCAQRPRRP